ncbi:MAG TPA: hypothetical protein RMF84_02475, partial [Polyangiaceae bacterium LLY-WYZ-14_1]|nr:hypothetical protein [Polyangiaceae bacterium LLY-WYZ-14_1]
GACAASRRSGGGGERRALPVCASAAEDAPGVLAFGVREDPDVPLGAELIAVRAGGQVDVLEKLAPGPAGLGEYSLVSVPPSGVAVAWRQRRSDDGPSDGRYRLLVREPGGRALTWTFERRTGIAGRFVDRRLLWLAGGARPRGSALYDLTTDQLIDLPAGIAPPTWSPSAPIRPETRFELVDGWTPARRDSSFEPELLFVNEAGEVRPAALPDGDRLVLLDDEGYVRSSQPGGDILAAIPWRGRWLAVSMGQEPADGVTVSVISPAAGEARREIPMPAPQEIGAIMGGPSFLAFYPPARADRTLGPVAVFDAQSERFTAMPSLDRPRSPSDDAYHRPRIQDERIVFGGDRLLAFSPETGVVSSFDARALGVAPIPSPISQGFGQVALGPRG